MIYMICCLFYRLWYLSFIIKSHVRGKKSGVQQSVHQGRSSQSTNQSQDRYPMPGYPGTCIEMKFVGFFSCLIRSDYNFAVIFFCYFVWQQRKDSLALKIVHKLSYRSLQEFAQLSLSILSSPVQKWESGWVKMKEMEFGRLWDQCTTLVFSVSFWLWSSKYSIIYSAHSSLLLSERNPNSSQNWKRCSVLNDPQ
jgi:hypothetical protein